MSAIKFVPISLDVATRAISLLRAVSRSSELTNSDRAGADNLSMFLGEAISIAGEHVPASELLCAELLELIGRVTGRPLSTIPGPRSLAEATAALEDMAPVLGGTVLRLPPRPERETEQAIEAATTRALADMPGPISIRPFVERRQRPRERAYDELEAVDVWAVPRTGEVWCGHVVRSIEWDSPKSVRLILASKPPPGDIDF